MPPTDASPPAVNGAHARTLGSEGRGSPHGLPGTAPGRTRRTRVPDRPPRVAGGGRSGFAPGQGATVMWFGTGGVIVPAAAR